MRVCFAMVLAACLLPGVSLAQSVSPDRSTAFAVELRAGAALESQPLGTTTGVSEGYFGLGEVHAAPVFGVGVLFPETVLGIRPLLRVSYAIGADVGGNWVPCEPGLACPAVLLPVDGTANRLEGTMGAQLPILAPAGPVRPYATAAIGFRRYGISWERIGHDGGFQLEAGSYGETDLLGRVGLGIVVELDRYEAIVEGAADFSSFGAGRVPIPLDPLMQESLALWAEPTIDLGRESIRHYEVVVGLRRYVR